MMKIAVIDKAVRAASFQERIDELLKSGTVTLDQLAMTNARDPLECTHINIDDSTDLSGLVGKEFDMVILGPNAAAEESEWNASLIGADLGHLINGTRDVLVLCDDAVAFAVNKRNGVTPAMAQALTKQERVLWYTGDRPIPTPGEIDPAVDYEVLVLDSVGGSRYMSNSEWLKEYCDARPMVQEEANRLAAQDHDRVITRLARNSIHGKLAPRASSEAFEPAYQAHERRIRVGKGQRKANRHNRWS